MSEEIRKKIDFSVKSFKPESGQTAFKIGAEFGYQLGHEEAMKELTRQAIDANSVKPVFDRAMAAGSKEPKP